MEVINTLISRDTAEILGQALLFSKINDKDPKTDDLLVQNAYSCYGHCVGESLLLHIQPKIEELVGFKLFPTYSYYRVYELGHEMPIHTDRDSCEISVSMTLKYNKTNWSIKIEDREIYLEPGDALIYKGREFPHWRDTYEGEEGSYLIQIFMHYVDSEGQFSHLKYDGRKGIGVD